MNFRFYFLTLLLFVTSTSKAQYDWDWAGTGGGNGADAATCITHDRFGNVYMAGTFNSITVNLGVTTLTSNGSYDVFIMKLNSQGTILWAKTAASVSTDECNGIACDGDGNVYISGNFADSQMIFDNDTIFSGGSKNIYVAKYDPNGNALWARTPNGSVTSYVGGIAADSIGNTYITGRYLGSGLTFGSTILPAANGLGAFYIASYDKNGNVRWASEANGNGTDHGFGISADNNGHVFVSGNTASASLLFSGGLNVVNTPGTYNVFNALYDSSGVLQWCKMLGGFCNAGGIAHDYHNNFYIDGYFNGDTLTLDTVHLLNTSGQNSFVAKFDLAGNVLWARNPSSTNINYGNSVCSDLTGNVYTTGYFTGATITFGTYVLTKAGTASTANTDLFTASYDANGTVRWAVRAGGTDSESGNGITTDYNGDAYVCGRANSPSFTAGNISLTTVAGNDVFIGKIANTPVGLNENKNNHGALVYPNPSNGNFTIVVSANFTEYSIIDITGKVIQKGFTHGRSTFEFSEINSGIYILNLKDSTKIISKKIIVY